MRMEKQFWKSKFCGSLTVTGKFIKTCFQPILYQLQLMKQRASFILRKIQNNVFSWNAYHLKWFLNYRSDIYGIFY